MCQVNWMLSERGAVVELPWAADRCPCVEKLRTGHRYRGGGRVLSNSW
jgi:hypothetical protein